jgi:hypothetical protein
VVAVGGVTKLLTQGEQEELLAQEQLATPECNPLPPEETWPEIASEALYGLAGEVVKTIEPHTEADPTGLLMDFLTFFGAYVGRAIDDPAEIPRAPEDYGGMKRGPYVQVEADQHFTNLFVCKVGETSKARKGTGTRWIKKLFNKVDSAWVRRRIGHGLSSGEGLVYAVRDPEWFFEKSKEDDRRKPVLGDAGELDKRLLVVEQEFSSALQAMRREGNTLSAMLRNAWDTGDLSPMTKNNRIRATGAHISVIAHITLEELRRTLDKTELHNGLGNRFLWACVRRSKLLPFGGNMQEVQLVDLAEKVRHAANWARGVQRVVWSEEAAELWAHIYNQLAEAKPGLLGAATARSEAQALRLALIYALLDFSETIEPEHLKAALAVIEYTEQSAKLIWGESTGDPIADEILDALRARERLTKSEIQGIFGRNLPKQRLKVALDLLLRLHLIEVERIPSGGRPVEVISLRKKRKK